MAVASTSFEVKQTVRTQPGAKTSALDVTTDRVYLITAEQAPPTANATGEGQPRSDQPNRPRGGRGGGRMVPGSFSILVVGK